MLAAIIYVDVEIPSDDEKSRREEGTDQAP